MKASDLILAILKSNHGKIQAKTTIQKVAYFSKQKIRLPRNIVFRPHYYGPYSAQIDFELDKLVGLGFLQQLSRTTINNRIMYEFTLTDQGKKMADDLQNKHPRDFDRVRHVVQTSKDVAGLNPLTLSYAAKVHYILTMLSQPIGYEEVTKEARKIGWKMENKDVEDGATLLVKLKLAKRAGA